MNTANAACPDLSAFQHPNVTLQEPVYDATGKFCQLAGVMDAYDGQDGNPYAIRFELRLPSAWNQRYVHQFNGGIDGIVVPATGPANIARPQDNALARGFAVVSSDAGHAIDAHPELGAQGPTQFGMDARARVNYGYGAVARLDPVARAIVQTAYGKPILYAYGIGRSNGGRHAMVAASRMPDAFDGLLIGYPGFNLPKAAIQHAWDAQALHEINGDIRTSLSQQDLDLLSRSILSQCDALDGLADGMIFQWQQCQQVFQPQSLQCAAASDTDCLAPAKVLALQKMIAGPTDATGMPLYSSWYWDSGFNSANWQMWKVRGNDARTNYLPRIVAMGAASLAQVFSTPPVELGADVQTLENFLLSYDFDHAPKALAATSSQFPQSALEVMLPPGLYEDGFEAYRQSGGKMLIYHGLSDPVFSAADTVNWFHQLPHSDDYARLYLIPGMPHGHSPDAPDDVDLLSPLQQWVENGIAPQALTASVKPANGQPVVSRPLCAYPGSAQYQAGDPALSTSFSCVTP